uniref:Uncharacterized protein n=1 Tax=Glossina pallidipes TaxID=7398 RepID=A0A1B0A2F1_GLOPL
MNFISSGLPLLVSTLLLCLSNSSMDVQTTTRKRNALWLSPISPILDAPRRATPWFPTSERLEDYGSNPFNNRGSYQARNPTVTCSRLYYPADARETNLPGRASKGYGGYGGNGGLRQYYGYWQPDYQGQRNRGYGYYTNTDYYGLPRSQQAARGQYINALRSYRGYD